MSRVIRPSGGILVIEKESGTNIGAVQIPNTSTAPASPAAGMLRYNSGFIEWYDGSTWVAPITSAGTASRLYVTRTINYNTAADSGSTIYNIGGGLAANSRILRVSATVETVFNDATAATFTLTAAGGGMTSILVANDTNIKAAHTYIKEFTGFQTSTGQLIVTFNADPNGNGGSTGVLHIIVEYFIQASF